MKASQSPRLRRQQQPLRFARECSGAETAEKLSFASPDAVPHHQCQPIGSDAWPVCQSRRQATDPQEAWSRTTPRLLQVQAAPDQKRRG